MNIFALDFYKHFNNSTMNEKEFELRRSIAIKLLNLQMQAIDKKIYNLMMGEGLIELPKPELQIKKDFWSRFFGK